MGIRIGINGLLIGSGSDSGMSSNILAKMLFWGKYSEISGGQMPNEIAGTTDYLTVSGSMGNETYQCPNTAPYIAADTDKIWFQSNGFIRTVATSELIGYDFPRTLVKYDDSSPYQIREIFILKSGQTLTTSELNAMYDYCRLSIWWNGTLNSNGYLKGNKLLAQKYTWTEYPIPIISTAVVQNAAPTNVVITFSQLLDVNYIPQTTDFALAGKTISNVSILGQVVTLTVTARYYYGNSISVSYTKPANNYLRSTLGSIISSVASQAVTNNVSAFVIVTKQGDGTGVATFKATVSSNITITLSGNAHFYSDAAGTLDESYTWNITSGALRTIYVKCTSGSSPMTFSDYTKLTTLGSSGAIGWSGTGGNYPYLTFNLDGFPNLTVVRTTNTTVVGNIENVPNMTYINFPLSAITGDLGLTNLPTNLTVCSINGHAMTQYTSGKTWANIAWTINGNGANYYASAEIDKILIDMAASVALIGKTITLKGTSSAPSGGAAVTTALATLRGVGRSNTVNTN